MNVYRTKVECGGQCLIDPSCDTFSYVGNECKLLKSDQLFKDETTKLEIYMEASLAARQYNWYFSIISLLVIHFIYFILRRDLLQYSIAVDGSWSAWGDFTSCACATESKSRARTCTSPAPARGGWDCNGETYQTASCTPSPCPSKISNWKNSVSHNYHHITHDATLWHEFQFINF